MWSDMLFAMIVNVGMVLINFIFTVVMMWRIARYYAVIFVVLFVGVHFFVAWLNKFALKN